MIIFLSLNTYCLAFFCTIRNPKINDNNLAKKNLGFGYIYQICPSLLLCVWNMFGRFQRLGLAPWNLSTNDVSGKPRDIFQHHDMLVHAGELCMYEKKLSQFQFLFSWNRWVKNLAIYNKKKLWSFETFIDNFSFTE